jgi:hypothetical protein
MQRTLKIGLIGFSATILLALLLKFTGISPFYIAPFTLPWAMAIIIGISQKNK